MRPHGLPLRRRLDMDRVAVVGTHEMPHVDCARTCRSWHATALECHPPSGVVVPKIFRILRAELLRRRAPDSVQLGGAALRG